MNLNLSADVTNASSPYPVGNDGQVDLHVDGTPGPYLFDWVGPYGFTSDAEDLQDVYAGSYSVVVTSSFCGEGELEIVVEDACEDFGISLEPSCICEPGYGMIEVEVVGGSNEYMFAWEGLGGIQNPLNPTAQNPQVAEAGSYAVTVTDNIIGCSATAQTEIVNCDFNIQNFNQTITPTCSGPGSGAYSLEIPEGLGVPPYYIFWTQIGGSVEEYTINDGNFSVENLDAGEYCINILSENGCSTGQACGIVIEEVEEPEIYLEVNPDGSGEGTIEIETSELFEFFWSNLYENEGYISTQDGIPSGPYTITLVSEDGICEYVLDVDLLTCSELLSAITPLEADVTPMLAVGGDQETLGAIDILNVSDLYPGYDFS